MVGLDKRVTLDFDAMNKGLPINEEEIREMFSNITKIDLHDNVIFEIIW